MTRRPLGGWVVAGIVTLGTLTCRPQPEPDEAPLTEEGIAEEPEPGSHIIPVVLSSFHIDMPEQIPSGTITFRIENRADDVEHSFVIQGEDVEKELEERLQPDASTRLQIELPAGSYLIFCPVHNHQGLGMERSLTVGEGHH